MPAALAHDLRSRRISVAIVGDATEMDGLQALPMMLQLAPKAKVLVVSSMSRDGTGAALRCLMRGAAHYIAKPSALDPAHGADAFRNELIEAIRTLGAA